MGDVVVDDEIFISWKHIKVLLGRTGGHTNSSKSLNARFKENAQNSFYQCDTSGVMTL